MSSRENGSSSTRSAGRAGGLSRADERLAERVLQKPTVKAGRKYRCGSCGLMFLLEDMNPDLDDEGRRVGWTCDFCY